MEKAVKPLKVVHITSRYQVFKAGVKQVLKALSAAQNNLDELEVWIYGTNSMELIAPNGQASQASLQELLALEPDLAVFHSIYIPSFYPVAKALRKAGVPYLIEPHGSMDKRAQIKSSLKKWIAHHLWIDRWIRKAEAIIYLCQEERKASRLQNLPFSILTNTFPTVFGITEEITTVNEPIRLMMLGRMDPMHKGLDRFFKTLRAMPQETSSQIQVDLYGIGSQENLTWMHKEIDKIDNLDITFHGPVFGQEKTEAFKKADIFCMFSRYEGLPLTLYEAAASGLPVLVTEGSNRTEWVNEYGNGWILWDRDEAVWGKQLANAIADYRQNPKGYKQNAIRSAKDLPTWEDIAKESIKVYRKWGKKDDERRESSQGQGQALDVQDAEKEVRATDPA